ncbi:hypothetical protein E2986_03298 [Frieseomelitta varia]|uniref:Uncharacterized protein n=1 Tax=Frieseomelitta varia TaxID=561572 RepID=A0A833VZ53_9HYME|nr:uncharacterized protein LOC122530797 [Frieseomelitta varia]KAF3425804.1 hypothetical protein E2986_03298 [Frieseomelitta varia]
MFFSTTKVLPLLSAFAASIVAQDTKTTVFPFSGNGSVLESPSREESPLRPDMTRSSELVAYHPTVPANNFLPVPSRMFIHHRSDNVLPYVYDHPHFAYPVAHSNDYPLGPSSKQLVIVSFIGLLLLFAIIQNTIVNVKRREMLTDVLSARRKRELYAAYNFNSVTPEQEDVLNEDARVQCIQRTVCLENRKLLKAFGATGKILAKYLTRGVEKSLKSSSGWFRLVRDAGEAGIRGEDCEVLYRRCDEEVSSGNA